MKKTDFDTSTEVTKKKTARDINAEPEMIELKRMIRDRELDPDRVIATVTEAGTVNLCPEQGEE